MKKHFMILAAAAACFGLLTMTGCEETNPDNGDGTEQTDGNEDGNGENEGDEGDEQEPAAELSIEKQWVADLSEAQDGSTMDFYARSKGDKEHALYCAGRSLQPDLENVAQDKPYLSMNGREVFRFAIQAMPDAIYGVLQGQPVEEIDLMIPHQANIRILEYVSKKMKFPMEKMFVNLDQFGNTSAASVPIALAQAWEEHKIKENMDYSFCHVFDTND